MVKINTIVLAKVPVWQGFSGRNRWMRDIIVRRKAVAAVPNTVDGWSVSLTLPDYGTVARHPKASRKSRARNATTPAVFAQECHRSLLRTEILDENDRRGAVTSRHD
jgi:hypothetical protein